VRQEIITNLKPTKWGLAISLRAAGIDLPNKRDLAFLSYGGSYLDFPPNSTYRVAIFYHVTYQSIKKSNSGHEEKTWASFQADTYEATKAHPEFSRMSLTEDKIVPYFVVLGRLE